MDSSSRLTKRQMILLRSVPMIAMFLYTLDSKIAWDRSRYQVGIIVVPSCDFFFLQIEMFKKAKYVTTNVFRASVACVVARERRNNWYCAPTAA